MKKYYCSYPFMGSLTCEVEAENEEQAQALAETIFDAMPNERIVESAQFTHIEVYED